MWGLRGAKLKVMQSPDRLSAGTEYQCAVGQIYQSMSLLVMHVIGMHATIDAFSKRMHVTYSTGERE